MKKVEHSTIGERIMLTETELGERRAFYCTIFGTKRIDESSYFPHSLWAVRAYSEKIKGHES